MKAELLIDITKKAVGGGGTPLFGFQLDATSGSPDMHCGRNRPAVVAGAVQA